MSHPAGPAGQSGTARTTGEEITIAAKPASVDLRARPLAKAKTVTLIALIEAGRQESVKRMLAYSSVAHAGFILTGVIAAPSHPSAIRPTRSSALGPRPPSHTSNGS